VRHLVSILLAPILGAAAYVLMGIGFAKRATLDWSTDTVISLALLLAAGAVLALLLLVRWSPIGLVLVGVVYLGVTIWAISAPASFVDATPDNVLGVHNALRTPVFVLPILAVPLLVTVFSGRRWRRTAYPQNQFAGPPPQFNPPQSGFNQPPAQSGFNQPPAPYGQPEQFGPPAPAGYQNNPLGAPYSGPPSYGSDPSSAPPYSSSAQPYSSSAPPYSDPPPPYGGQPPFSPETTRRL
jgi:hypothetical protein